MAKLTQVVPRRSWLSPEESPGRLLQGTVIDLFFDRVAHRQDNPALREHVDGRWQAISWEAYGSSVREIGAGLAGLGISVGDRVGILGANQPRWHMADLGILAAGAVSVPAYPTGTASQLAYVLRHSGCRACFVGDRDQLAKVLLVQRRVPDLERVIFMRQPPDGLDDDLLLTVDELCAAGRDVLRRAPDTLQERAASIGRSTTATIVYTSGTTGPPKGVVITHGNVMETVRSLTDVVHVGPTDRFFSFLPLSHIAERVVSHFGHIYAGGETWFARSLATVADDLRACRPTVFLAVPRVWQKFQAALCERFEQMPRPLKALVDRYIELGLAGLENRGEAGWPGLRDLAAYRALDRTVGAHIRSGVGLNRGRVFVSAAAPIHPDLLRWFHALGMPIAEVYGQTEDCGPTTMNRPGRIRIGTVGEPLPRIGVRIAEDGEVLVRGPTVCSGYHADPTATAALLDSEGWMHSGDLGHLDSDGYLRITGRKKDLIVTASGKNVAPQDMETVLGADPLIAEAVVVGDGRPYLTALLALEREAAVALVGHQFGPTDMEALASHPAVLAAIDEAVERLNTSHAPAERIRAWRVLPHELTVADGELTPTFKVRREAVVTRFGELIDEMYAGH